MALSFAMQTFLFGLRRFLKIRVSDPVPPRAPIPLIYMLEKWFWGGLIVFPLFTVSTILSLMTALLEGSFSLYFLKFNIFEIPYILAGTFSLMGWVFLTWMSLDITWVSMKRRISILEGAQRSAIADLSAVMFISVGLMIVITGIVIINSYVIIAGFIFVLAGLAISSAHSYIH